MGAGRIRHRLLDPTHSRLTLGAWSWAGIAGILATSDTDLTDVEPDELREACHSPSACGDVVWWGAG